MIKKKKNSLADKKEKQFEKYLKRKLDQQYNRSNLFDEISQYSVKKTSVNLESIKNFSLKNSTLSKSSLPLPSPSLTHSTFIPQINESIPPSQNGNSSTLLQDKENSDTINLESKKAIKSISPPIKESLHVFMNKFPTIDTEMNIQVGKQKTFSNPISTSESDDENAFNSSTSPFTLPSLQSQSSMENSIKSQKSSHVTVIRDPSIQAFREKLSIFHEEHVIIEAIRNNPVTIIIGETGSGKTTQIPQFLYENGFGCNYSNFNSINNPIKSINSVNSSNSTSTINSISHSPFSGMIGMTQPRRVAAISVANRISFELGLEHYRSDNNSKSKTNENGNEIKTEGIKSLPSPPPSSTIVSHHVRHDCNVSPNTVIKVMTDGILLRELSFDLLLSRYSIIILDEAHERNVNTDLLLTILSKVIKVRNEMHSKGELHKGLPVSKLHLIIMSATLNVHDFLGSELFKSPPPIVKIESRQYPVGIHFANRSIIDSNSNLFENSSSSSNSDSSLLDEAAKIITRIHKKLPPGGILIFLTGKREIYELIKKLKNKSIHSNKREIGNCDDYEQFDSDHNDNDDLMNNSQSHSSSESLLSSSSDQEGGEDFKNENDNCPFDDDTSDHDDNDELIESKENKENQNEIVKNKENSNMKNKEKFFLNNDSLHILPLYSLMTLEAQNRVFETPPLEKRLCVIATNIAESSITIPNIRYVVDSGRVKERIIDPISGIQKYTIGWCSQASATQRAGRAGRTGPGHCYRLFTSAQFQLYFPEFSIPEIKKCQLDHVVLQMKNFGIVKIDKCPIPGGIDPDSLWKAEERLKLLSSLDEKTGMITELGREMAMFPISPQWSRMLVLAIKRARRLETESKMETELEIQKIKSIDKEISTKEMMTRYLPLTCAFVACISCEGGRDPFDRDNSESFKYSHSSKDENKRNKNEDEENDSHENHHQSEMINLNIKTKRHSSSRNTSDMFPILELFLTILRLTRIDSNDNKDEKGRAKRAKERGMERNFKRDNEKIKSFCKKRGLLTRHIEEIRSNYEQLKKYIIEYFSIPNEIFSAFPNSFFNSFDNKNLNLTEMDEIEKISKREEIYLARLLLKSLAGNLAERVSSSMLKTIDSNGMKRIKRVKSKLPMYRPLLSKEKNVMNDCKGDGEEIFYLMHGSSCLIKSPPRYVLYNELLESNGRLIIRGITAIKREWIFND